MIGLPITVMLSCYHVLFLLTRLIVRLSKPLSCLSCLQTFVHCGQTVGQIKMKLVHKYLYLWSPYAIGQTIIFLPCDFYLSSFFLFSFLA